MDFYENEPVSLYLNELELLEQMTSPKQEITLYKHPFLGITLVINGEIQHIQNYQCPYHELLVHLPASFIEEPQTALIIGGGSLFAAYELLKYPSIKSIILCDYDSTVLFLMEKYYDHAQKVLHDPRFHFIEHEGIDYITTCTKQFDLIINDCFNLLQMSEKNNVSLYLMLKRLLTPIGVCSDIIYRHIFDDHITHNSIAEIKNHGEVVLSLVTIPEYPGILHVETLWGNSKYLSQQAKESKNSFHKKIMAEKLTPFDFYYPNHIPYYLHLPPYIKSKL